MGGHMDCFLVFEKDRSGSGYRRQPQDRFQQSGFAHAVASDDDDQLTWIDV